MLKARLRFTDDKLFVYYDKDNVALFNVASILTPGFVDLKNIEKFSTTGISLFFDNDKTNNSEEILKTMLKVANDIADALDLSILDENRQKLTNEKLNKLFEKLCKPVETIEHEETYT